MSLFRIIFSKVALGIILTCISFTSLAQQSLTESVINRWLGSLEAIDAWGKAHEKELDALEDENDMSDGLDPEEMVASLKKSGYYHDVKSLLRKHGFSSPEEWADVQSRIMKAVMSLQLEQHKMQFDIEAELDRIRKNPSIPAEQKEMMIGMMREQMGAMRSMSNASPEDKRAVQPYIQKIMQKLDQMDDGEEDDMEETPGMY